MKIEKEEKFIPVKITLETEEEKDVLYHMGNCSSQIAIFMRKEYGLDVRKVERVLGLLYGIRH